MRTNRIQGAINRRNKALWRRAEEQLDLYPRKTLREVYRIFKALSPSKTKEWQKE